jgi:hypothetical protein
VHLRSITGGSDRRTAEEVCFLLHGIYGFGSCLAVGTMYVRSVAVGPGLWTTEADLYYTQARKLNLKSFGVKVCTVYSRTYTQRHFHGFQEFDL